MEPDYPHFKAADFVCDDAFLRHQLYPTTESRRFWREYLADHPNATTAWQEAQQLLEAVRSGLNEYSRTFLSAEAETALLQRIRQTNAQYASETKISPLPVRRWWSAGAAAAVVLLSLAWYFLAKNNDTQAAYQQLTENQSDLLIEKINPTAGVQTILLPDNSVAVLSSGSRLSYRKDYGRRDRTIFLSGQAEFDVKKDPAKPFLVFANEIVTRVLGTSFTVTAFEKDADITVQVASGRVSVYRNEKVSARPDPGAGQPLLLLPNQRAVFVRSGAVFSKSLVDNPALIATTPSTARPAFTYSESPVSAVFDDLKQAYGIDIVFDAEALQGCQLTASLSEESFADKLDIICKSIGATHEVVDARVVITAAGCR